MANEVQQAQKSASEVLAEVQAEADKLEAKAKSGVSWVKAHWVVIAGATGTILGFGLGILAHHL